MVKERDLHFFPEDSRLVIDELFIETQPAHLQLHAARELSPEERDVLRAEITRSRLQSIDGPINVSHFDTPQGKQTTHDDE